MARRAKTKVGGGPDARTMLAAGSRGRDSQERAEAQQLQSIQSGGDRVAGAISQAGDRIQGARQATRQAEAQQKDLDFRKQSETGRQMQTQRGQELDEATQGYERAPGGDQPPLLQDDRAKRVQAGMDQGTAEPGAAPAGETSSRTPEQVASLQSAGQQPVEIGAQGSVMPGIQDPKDKTAPGGLRRSASGQASDKARQTEADAKMMASMASMARAEGAFATARAKGDAEAMENNAEAMRASMDTTRGRLNKLLSGEGDPLAIVQAYAGKNPSADQALEAAGDKPSQDPNILATAARLTEGQLAFQNISYMAATGKPPIDRQENSPIWQRFSQNAIAVESALLSGQAVDSVNDAFDEEFGNAQAMQAWQGIQSYTEQQEFVRRITAKTMMQMDEMERMAGIEAAASQQTQKMSELETENAGLRAQIEQMGAQQQQMMETQGLMEEGQTLEQRGLTTTEELPGGQQVQSGSDFRRGQYQPPGDEPQSRPSRERVKRHKYSSGSK